MSTVSNSRFCAKIGEADFSVIWHLWFQTNNIASKARNCNLEHIKEHLEDIKCQSPRSLLKNLTNRVS